MPPQLPLELKVLVTQFRATRLAQAKQAYGSTW